MNKIKILVVEDEIIIADHLCDILDDLGYAPLEPAINYTDAISQISTEIPDFAILDIELGGRKTGIDLAQYIIENYNFPFIFLTSNTDPQTVEKAKKVNPPAYLTKPFTKESIYAAIEITLSNSKKIEIINKDNYALKNSFFIKENGALKKIQFNDILYLKSDHVYTEIKLKSGNLKIVRIGLNTIIDKLNKQFIRVHRSYIVNQNHITEVQANSLNILNDVIPIGAKFKKDLIKKLNSL